MLGIVAGSGLGSNWGSGVTDSCSLCIMRSMRRATALLRWVALPTSARGARTPSSGWAVISSTISAGSGLALRWVAGLGRLRAGDLEAVEEQAGAAGVDVVGGDALEDFADGLLDGGTVFRQRKVEGGAAASALLRVGDGFSGGVVVVAEIFSAQAGAAATMAIGEDVAALVLFDGWCCVFHWWVPLPLKVCKVFKRKDLRPDFPVCRSGLNAKARLGGRAFSYYF
jgi:hypothetical protein